MRWTFKEDSILVELEHALDWQASVAVLEIAHDPECLRRLEELELLRAMLQEEPVAGPAPEPQSSGFVIERLLPSLAVFLLLVLSPLPVSGVASVGAASGVAALVGALAPRLDRHARAAL